MRDEETQKMLNGLLEIGDEIIAIDNVNVKSSSIVEVNHLMVNKIKILLHVIPYVNSRRNWLLNLSAFNYEFSWTSSA